MTLYSLSNNIERNYKVYKIKKNNGGFRIIYEPNSLLKQIQKSILNKLYGRILFVLQVNSADKEFIKYKRFVLSLY